MTDLLLITSGEYIDASMQVEFGRLPPSLLPVRNTTLLELQIELSHKLPDEKVITLPEDFELPNWAARAISSLGFLILRQPLGLSLGEAIGLALASRSMSVGSVSILHGDTLIPGLDTDYLDVFSTYQIESSGHWAKVKVGDQQQTFTREFVHGVASEEVLTGYFSFSESSKFVSELKLAGGDFFQALNAYQATHPIEMAKLEWYDFGRLNTYFKSRAAFSTERHFNSMEFHSDFVTKRSTDTLKLKAEATWYESLPPELKIWCPKFLGRGGSSSPESFSYSVEHLRFCTLAELYVFADLPLMQWEKIISGAVSFLAACRNFSDPEPFFSPTFYADKTSERLETYSAQSGLSLTRDLKLNGKKTGSLEQLLGNALDVVGTINHDSIMHGDFCFSNIFFDSRREDILAVDPRGGFDLSRPSIFGDSAYDAGKLYHSFLGFYDLIIAGRYEMTANTEWDISLKFEIGAGQAEVSKMFEKALNSSGLISREVGIAHAILLFLSMPPLHSDRPDRQKAFIANAVRLGQEIF